VAYHRDLSSVLDRLWHTSQDPHAMAGIRMIIIQLNIIINTKAIAEIALSFLHLLLCLLLMSLYAVSSSATTIRVRQDGTGDANSIRAALLLAQPHDTVLVSPGYYWEAPIYLIQMAIHLISEAGPQETTIKLLKTSSDDVTIIEMKDIIGPCSIVGFTITGASGGFLDLGGAINCNNSALVIRNNIITYNWCSNSGAIFCTGSPAPTIEGNLIYDNEQWANGTIGVADCSPIIQNNTIVYNQSTDGTSALCITGGSSWPIIRNNIIAHNSSNAVGPAIFATTPMAQIAFECNDVWDNAPTNYGGTFADQTGINGNISQDPLFCGVVASGNYYLQAGSPCAGANVPANCAGIGMGCYPVNCTVSIESNSWGGIKAYFKEKER
jgi:hypothetical protein